MFRLTCIELDNGEFAVYINHHYLGSEDASGERLSLGEVLEQLSLLPGVELQTLLEPVPECDDWCWNDIADRVLPSRPACRDDVTVAGLIARLKQYPPDALCMGTFWLEDDFLSLDSSLSEEEIAEAMRIGDHSHDAGIGFNWDTLHQPKVEWEIQPIVQHVVQCKFNQNLTFQHGSEAGICRALAGRHARCGAGAAPGGAAQSVQCPLLGPVGDVPGGVALAAG